MPENKNDISRAFHDWLSDSDADIFPFTVGNNRGTVISAMKNANFDYLYCQPHYGKGCALERGDSFKYAGIYCRLDRLVYDAQYEIRYLEGIPQDFNSRSAEKLRDRLKADVRRLVEEAVGNDRNKLRITELADPRSRDDLAHFQKYTAYEKARADYLDGIEPDGFSYQCQYTPGNWTEDSLLSYILDPAAYAQSEADGYLDTEQETILYSFLAHDATAAAFEALMVNTKDNAHVIKLIRDAVNKSSAKMVTVTIRKDGTEFTFKTSADDLRRDCGRTYRTWNMAAPDRREFEKLFVRSGEYGPEDIVRVTYARSVLYEAKT